jgi:hypothetical protein
MEGAEIFAPDVLASARVFSIKDLAPAISCQQADLSASESAGPVVVAAL